MTVAKLVVVGDRKYRLVLLGQKVNSMGKCGLQHFIQTKFYESGIHLKYILELHYNLLNSSAFLHTYVEDIEDISTRNGYKQKAWKWTACKGSRF